MVLKKKKKKNLIAKVDLVRGDDGCRELAK